MVDGEIMGLTNHHVAFGDSRLEAFPTSEEEASGVSYTFLQPAEADLEQRIKQHEARRKAIIDYQQKYKEDASRYADEISNIDAELVKLRLWTPEKSVLGTVWRSSGIRAREADKTRRFMLDWALIKLDNPERFSNHDKFVNKVRICRIGIQQGMLLIAYRFQSTWTSTELEASHILTLQ